MPNEPGRIQPLRFVAALVGASLAVMAFVPTPAHAQLFGNDEERTRYGGQTDTTAPRLPKPPVGADETPELTPPGIRAAPRPPAATAPATPADDKKMAEELAVAEEAARLAFRGREIEELSGAVKEFESQVREYRGDVQLLIERSFEKEKEHLGANFEKQIRVLEVGERQERLDAIALFERFVVRYPDDEKYTPDAMTRLAELYYEKSIDDQQVALADFEDRVKLGAVDDAPPELVRSFDKSIALYQQIITRFPTYRLIDSIYYLLGWCLAEQGEPEQARDTFRALIAGYPKSRYLAEAWVRIGEYYFDYSGPEDVDDKLRESIKAYSQAITFTESSLYDKALYKLGWAYYRLNDFDNGVEAFVKLIDYYDGLKVAGKDSGADLRAEALQYTAISFADEKWGGVSKMVEFFGSRGGRPYDFELFRKLGDVLFDSTRYREAVEAYRIVLQRAPAAADAPQIQERIVQCFARDQDKPSAFAEREKLVSDYGEKSAWAHANKGDQEILRAARELVERSLLATAQYHHAQAAEYEKTASSEETPVADRDAATARAFQSYLAAAKAYGDYLAEFPHSKNLYDIQYFHAETLYNSLQFAAAADEYAKVRDSNTDNKYLTNAAYYVVLALQRQIEQEEAQGLLERRLPCNPESCKAVVDFTPQQIPEVRLRLIAAADDYMKKIPTAEDAPLLSYKAGQTFFVYFHFDEARKRYEDVIGRFPEKDVAEYSYEDILISYLLLSDWINVEQFAGRMIAESKSVQNDPKKISEKRLLKYGARFNRANISMGARKWEEASKLYVSIVDDTEKEAKKWGKWEEADKALYNAATCFKEARRFDSAMRTYERLFSDYPSSSLAEAALFLVADSADKAYEYEKAIDRYMLLVERYPNSKDRVGALFNASQLLEALQRYPEAARAYKRYADIFPNEADAPDQAYQAAVIYQRMRDWKGMIGGLQDFVRKYEKIPAQAEKIVQAHLKIGHAWRALMKEKQDASSNEKAAVATLEKNAIESFQKSVKEFERLKMTPDNYSAAQAASESAFWLAEVEFDLFQKMKFDPKGKGAKLNKSMQEQLEGLAKALENMKKRYTGVIVAYRWPEWMMAALYRIGFADEQFAQKLLDSPCPADVKALAGEEGCTEYRIALEEMMAPINDRAILAFETAADKATELRIVNDWTKLTMEKVCQYTPTKCKSLKDPRAALIFDPLSPGPITDDPEGKQDVQYLVAAPPDPTLPSLSDVQPRRVASGGTVTLSGHNLSGDPAAISVKIGNLVLLIVSATADQIVATVPAGVTNATLSVTTPSGAATTTYKVEVLPAGTPGIGSPANVVPTPPAPVDAARPAAPQSLAETGVTP